MASILFRGARVRYADLRSEEAGIYARLHLQTDLSGPVQEAMDWGEIPEGINSAKLTGKISGHHLVLTPNDKQLRNNEVQLDCGDIGDFALVPSKNDDGEVDGYRLNFVARTNAVGAIAKVEAYMRVCGGADAALKISYQKQGELELAEGSADDDGADDDPEAEGEPAEAPLAPAAVMGGTHQRGTKGKRRGSGLPVDPGDPAWGSTVEVV